MKVTLTPYTWRHCLTYPKEPLLKLCIYTSHAKTSQNLKFVKQRRHLLISVSPVHLLYSWYVQPVHTKLAHTHTHTHTLCPNQSVDNDSIIVDCEQQRITDVWTHVNGECPALVFRQRTCHMLHLNNNINCIFQMSEKKLWFIVWIVW